MISARVVMAGIYQRTGPDGVGVFEGLRVYIQQELVEGPSMMFSHHW
jgi:hypothetical protein